MPLVEGGACRQGEPGKPPQFIDAIANKGRGPNARTSTANRIAIAAVCHPEAANPILRTILASKPVQVPN